MNIIEISQKFPNEIDVIKHFEKIRWGKQPLCVYCGSKDISERAQDNRYKCYACNKTFSVTVNTQLHNTRIPLKTWIYAFSIVSDAKKGLSALQLQRNLNISYPTAWAMYHKIRELMAMENENIQLSGVTEQDETFIGGKPRKQSNPKGLPQKRNKELDADIQGLKDKGFQIKRGHRQVACDIDVKRGRGSQKMTPVVGIVQRDGNVVAEVMRHLTYDKLKELVNKYVDKDESVLITDEYSGYNKFSKIIEHISIDHKTMYSYKGINTNTIESFWAIVKRQIIGQHHSVSVKYLPNYVAETVFKFNNRKKDDMFITLIKNSMVEIEKGQNE